MLWLRVRCSFVACSVGGYEVGEQADLADADVNVFLLIYNLFDPSLQMWRLSLLKYLAVKLDDEVMGRGVAVCEVGKIEEKGLEVEELRMEDGGCGSVACRDCLAVMKRADIHADGRAGGAVAGKEQIHPDESEEDSGAEREAQRRSERSTGAAVNDQGEGGAFGCRREIEKKKAGPNGCNGNGAKGVMPAAVLAGEGKGAVAEKATVVQRQFMLLEQTTDSINRQELEWPVTTLGGSGIGLSAAGRTSFPTGSTAMEQLMSTMSWSLGKVAFETAHVLRMPPTRRLSLPMQRLLVPLKTGLQLWVM
ncbi:uncharacterized protein MONOS_4803 [Monocercomonoides exilis]|uniref:uncharacterized protein n=1 Tax=Monocercomonoides exilis TaxID=2049356 RepID=UPI0035595974|nr:hypothetical protein MONOS_4803 [Monocercomonoides exilis]|eukprot:MONOS_4803.1-p1 / transcript=MONOS_4803.1 / gene=MONOS_4803 / organism=Monocercomonoides_exilis_PA203 / gene_product=unspecified product / transcript_product=unspecified product / location=Mono_scaffold00133:52360-53816(-) / protein_length=307 / sequence_SO=supercontig / SO=protein_coding / is_pseudo=false